MYRKAITIILLIVGVGIISTHRGCLKHKEINPNPPSTKGGPMVYIPAGEFWMGCNGKECHERNMPYQKVYIDAFFIDKYEVTVREYRECVLDKRCIDPSPYITRGDELGQDFNWDHPVRENHPMNCVSWHEARKYCNWVGKRLPTEAEWEKAARGTDGRKYPWGDEEASCEFAVMHEPGPYKIEGCGKRSTWPVGSKPLGASPYGAVDMAGNISEWVLNKDSDSPEAFKLRIIRGGSFFGTTHSLYVYSRSHRGEDSMEDFIGFRCALEARNN